MTPSQKAGELIEKFRKITTYQYQEYAGANYSTFEHDIETLRNCAMQYVGEILELDVMWLGEDVVADYPKVYSPDQCREFWQSVKDELNKIK